MQISEMKYEVDDNKNKVSASDGPATPYQHIELSQDREPATKSDMESVDHQEAI